MIERGRPLAVAITGGIGAGKSAALEAFARRGVPTLSSDDVVHRLLREDAEVRAAIAERLGADVLDADGAVDRARVATIVFADRDALLWLEALLHPRVAREYLGWRDALRARPDPPALCVVEVPLLYESGADARFDVVVVVTAPPEVRERRRRPRRDRRDDRLMADDEKVRRADYAFVNDGSLEDLDAFVGGVIAELTRAS